MSKHLRLGLIGSPVYHSKSPNIYAELFKKYDTSGSFSVIEVEQNRLPYINEIVQKYRLDAFAVTMPYKKTIIGYLDGISQAARLLQSVNLVVVRNDKLYGYSTDGIGFVKALASSGVEICGKNVLIYGTGGAAAAVAYELNNASANVYIVGRSTDKAQMLANQLGVFDAQEIDLTEKDIFINATPLGMTGHEEFANFDFLKTAKCDTVICDLIYSPQCTRLLSEAQLLNHKTINGFGMLKMQAEAAFEIINKD